MLHLAERVSKRARIGSGGLGLEDDSNEALGCSGLPYDQLILPRTRTQPPLQINLDPAGNLAHTQTRVCRPPVPISLSISDESAASGLGQISTAPPRLDLTASAVQFGNFTEFDSSTGVAHPACSSKRSDHSRSQAVKPAEATNFTWDDFESACNGAAPSSSSSSLVSSSHAGSQAYQVNFSSPAKTQVVMAAANAAVGLESNLVHWDEPRMQLRVLDVVSDTKFGNYLLIFARCGSYIRRLRAAATSLRLMVHDRNDSRTALALAASIESEVNGFVLLPEFQSPSGLVKLYAHCFKVNSLAANLAELIGCADLNAGGRLLRVPPAVTILDRAYLRAALQQSQRWHGAMLWRLVWATMSPWLDQLSFAVGLTEQLVVRTASPDMKQAYFPELFLDPDENSGTTVVVNATNVPKFVPLDIARAAGQCYNMLVLLGLKGYDAVHAGKTDMQPLSLQHNVHNDDKDQPYLSLTSQQPNSVQAGVHTLLDNLHSPLPTHDPAESSSEPRTLSVESQFWRVLAPVMVRYSFLNVVVKQVLQDELAELRNLVVGIYLLGNGEFWSVFQDLATAMYKDWTNAASYIPAMNSLVLETNSNVYFSLGTEMRGDLRLVCKHPTTITSAFPRSCVQKWHTTFSTLLRLHYNKEYSAFALLAADITAAVRRIDQVLGDEVFGIQEVVEAFDQIPTGLE